MVIKIYTQFRKFSESCYSQILYVNENIFMPLFFCMDKKLKIKKHLAFLNFLAV